MNIDKQDFDQLHVPDEYYSQEGIASFCEDEAKEYNPLLILTEALGEIVGINNTELLAKAIIRAVKKGKLEKLGRSNSYSILFEGRMKVLSVYKGKEGMAVIPLSRDALEQIRQYC